MWFNKQKSEPLPDTKVKFREVSESSIPLHEVNAESVRARIEEMERIMLEYKKQQSVINYNEVISWLAKAHYMPFSFGSELTLMEPELRKLNRLGFKVTVKEQKHEISAGCSFPHTYTQIDYLDNERQTSKEAPQAS